MALDGNSGILHAAARRADDENRDAYFAADWGERVVITVAVSAAVVVVALIAVLMGTVGP
jgi:hypothetical protein